MALHFKKTGNLTDRAKVDVPISGIRRLRDQNLLALAADIVTLANTAKTETGATDRGITTARITDLTTAISAYETALNAPRSQIVNRSALLRELETQVAGLLDALSDLDDLIIQFGGTPAGACSSVRGNPPATSSTPATAPEHHHRHRLRLP